MEVIVVTDRHELAARAADRVEALVRRKPDAVLGVATGSSPLGLYAELAARVRAGLDLSRVRAFALDEYVGLGPADPQSYATVVRENVTEPLGLDPRNVHVPDGTASDLEEACAAYERAIRVAGGVDLQLLGIGSNGHIGFNEPSSSFASRTRVTTLAPSTRADNARFFADPAEVPERSVTQGLATIMAARSILLLAAGPGKAEAIARAVEGPVTEACPASILQRHPAATVIADEEAAARLPVAERDGAVVRS